MIDGNGVLSLTVVSDGRMSELLLRLSIDGGLLSLRTADGRRPVAAVYLDDDFCNGLRQVAAASATAVPLDALQAIHLKPATED